jgi:hypothetical protein
VTVPAASWHTGPLWWLFVEDAPDPGPRPDSAACPGVALHLRAPDGRQRTLAVVEGHLRWVEIFTAA